MKTIRKKKLLSILSVAIPLSLTIATTTLIPVSTAQSLVPGGQLMSVETINGKKVYYKEYPDSALWAVGCNPATYAKMNEKYIAARTNDHINEYLSYTQQLAQQTPNSSGTYGPATGASRCFEDAARQVQNAQKIADAVMGMFTGTFNWRELAAGTADMWKNKACQEINNLTGNLVSNATGGMLNGSNPVNNAVNQATGSYNNAVGGNVINSQGSGGIGNNSGGQVFSPGTGIGSGNSNN